MSDGKNTEKVQGFWIDLLTTPALYIGAGGGGGLIGGFILGFILNKLFG
jgi:hypothetical protein